MRPATSPVTGMGPTVLASSITPAPRLPHTPHTPNTPHAHLRLPVTSTLVAATGLGVAGDVMLRGGIWRVGFALWIAQLIISVVALGGRGSRSRNLLLVGLGLAAAGLVWRDADALYAIDMLSVLCTGALLIWHGTGARLGQLTVVESARAALLAVLNSLGGAGGVVAQVARATDEHRPHRARWRALLVGAALAALPIVVVTALLASSDRYFDELLTQVGRVVAIDGVEHIMVAGLLTWLAAGWLRAGLGEAIRAPITQVRSPALPFVSVSVVLYALIGLLSLFVATQARVLFGGAAFLAATEGLTAAAYAREGFFQLVLAAGVVLGTLVLADWLMADDDTHGQRRLRLAGRVLVALVTLLLVSAAARIVLYVQAFGLTVDRTIAAAAIVWVAAALVACTATTLRGRADRFAPVTLALTVAWVALFNLANPEAVVVRINAARTTTGTTFDAAYHANLSADALPALRAAAPTLSLADCQALDAALRTRWNQRMTNAEDSGHDWRSRSLALARARAFFASGRSVCANDASHRTASPLTP